MTVEEKKGKNKKGGTMASSKKTQKRLVKDKPLFYYSRLKKPLDNIKGPKRRIAFVASICDEEDTGH